MTRLPHGTRAESQAETDRAVGLLASLQNVDAALLARQDRLTLAFLRHDLSQEAQHEQAWLAESPVTPYANMHLGWVARSVLGPMVIETAADLEHWSGLWRDLSRSLQASSERLQVQAALGRRLARPAIAPAVKAWQGLRAQLAALLTAQAGSPQAVADGLRSAWRTQAKALRDEYVLPALEALIDQLSDADYAAAAPEAVGLMHQPGGEAEYRRQLLANLTEDDDAERIHRVGLAQVAELAERMAALRSRLGFQGSEADFHAQLKHDPRAIAQSPEEVAQRYGRALARIEPLLPTLFKDMPPSPHAVARLAPELEGSMTYGYYEMPRAVGEPGTYHYNASDLANRSQLQVAALIYHELAPGHHFHLSRQMAMTQLPPLRQHALGYTVFNEGWAEYATGQAEALGCFADPYDHYGLLVLQRFAAQRLVVDTGMNALGWTLARAHAYMRANTLEGDAQVRSELLRYSTDIPAQALTYRLGFLAFQQLRDDTQARLGHRFDVRDYHEAVLGAGALPLATWRAHVNEVMA